MKKFIGIKDIKAKPFGRISFENMIEGKKDTHKSDEMGYLVEYLNSPSEKFKYLGYENYISWSPEHVFINSHIETKDTNSKIVLTAIQKSEEGLEKVIISPYDLDENGNPTVTEEGIDSKIINEVYDCPKGMTLTRCILTLENGFTVTGESASASKEKFDKKLGAKYARENAINKIWAFEGYLLREKLFRLNMNNA